MSSEKRVADGCHEYREKGINKNGYRVESLFIGLSSFVYGRTFWCYDPAKSLGHTNECGVNVKCGQSFLCGF